MDDVTEKMKGPFAEHGVGENILQELLRSWEDKISRMAVANFPTRYEEPYAYDGAEDLSPNGNQYGYDTNEGLSPYDGGSSSQNGGANGYRLPQNDGANDDVNEDAVPNPSMTTQQIDELILQKWNKAQSKKTKIPQHDGADDDDDDDDDDEVAEEIGSDLDDDEEDDEEAETEHLILCQYEKVNRIKNKWKCTLKDGIVNVNGKDYLFNRANGDFEW
ncbi:hypothetical protein HDV00_002542 [Rhizophlyctis rosea]|nr:hypothetical protein HDV00_002542 [Rhizophlyctis rosea]